tara:strand:- start:2344 stop:2757 length:414 start_codon:yes stop_codon:yes gene_type:complete
MTKMKKLNYYEILIWAFVVGVLLSIATPVQAQNHIFTDKEVVKMDSLFQVYEQKDSLQKIEINLLNKQLINYKTLQQQDSLQIMYLNQNITLLNQRIDLYVDLTKELEPKWYQKPAVQFFLGAATIVTSSWVVSNIK